MSNVRYRMDASLLVVAIILYGLAGLYLLGSVGSLVIRGSRLAIAREGRLFLRCAIYTLVILVLAIVFTQLLGAAWPQPKYIPLYAGYIALCNYLANVAPRRWHVRSNAAETSSP